MANGSDLHELTLNSFLFGDSSSYLEELYEAFLQDPNSVPVEWQKHFASFSLDKSAIKEDVSHATIREEFKQISKNSGRMKQAGESNSFSVEKARKQGHVFQLINAYRSHGHHYAKLDPLGTERDSEMPDLDLGHHGLSHNDFDMTFMTNSFRGTGKPVATLKEIFVALNETYCNTMGIEYMHITDIRQTMWLQQHIEPSCCKPTFSSEKKKSILAHLNAAQNFEQFLGKKYVGQKRFSLEGGESLIPMLHEIIQQASHDGTKECVIGMAHRGRLNVLINVLGKAPSQLFEEFEGKYVDETRSGDVKYHLGFSSDINTSNGLIHLTLGFNPSHLEIISPVVEGSVRARQERRSDIDRNMVIPLIIHGDAAFAGQGVVMETLNMSQARGYCTGGTIHIVINNQIGFTTSNPVDARSTLYCTDVAKMVQAPIFHVNGDDPEMVVYAAQLAFEYRRNFNKDVVIDLVCYRRHGHNESDEPSITQPLMYEKIRQHKTTLEIYAEKLQSEGLIQSDDVIKLAEKYKDKLDKGECVVDIMKNPISRDFAVSWSEFLNQEWTADYDSQLEIKALSKLANKILQLPENFSLQKQVEKEWQARQLMANGELAVNWGFAETLAYATLLEEGYPVRISGQDCGRGTFTHRHAVLHDCQNGGLYIPLQNISNEQGRFTIIDSILSEEGVLGFEYGYSSAEPNTLVIWEAQFGDFANGAQVVIDQFISSGYQKWGLLCGISLFLPHGYEGMGPEHSSARLERFLQLCAQNNMQVCVPSTPAQCFHMIRRQMKRPVRKPLVVMTPKSLLRHKLATSTLEELATGKFYNVIDEIDTLESKKVKRVVLCSGKIYYELLQKRRDDKREDVAIIRIEQLYPFPEKELKAILANYQHAKEIVWCQEEPKNQGAWYSTQHYFLSCLNKGQTLGYAGREAFAAPAVGYSEVHKKQQSKLVEDALG